MIYPRKNILLHGILDAYVRYILKRNFHQIDFEPVTVDPNKSILLIGNHFSIWDGMLLYWVLDHFSDKRFHVLLLEETAKTQPMLKYGGAFSIHRGSRDIIKALAYAAELLNDANNLVLIYPQGKLYSNFIDKVQFEKGILRVMEAAKGKFQLLFATTFIENFSRKKPMANVYLRAEALTDFDNIAQLEDAYQKHYDASRGQQTQIVL